MKALEKTEKDDEEDASVPDDLKEFISVYNNSDSMAKLAILSLVDHSKELLMKAFNCTKYRIEQARKWKSLSDGLLIPKKEQFSRKRLDLNKSEHFLDFIFSCKMWHMVWPP